jgi:uncharacterized protein DUF5666
MRLGFTWFVVGVFFLLLLVSFSSDAQQSGGQVSLPATGSVGPGQGSAKTPPAASQPPAENGPASSKGTSSATTTTPADTSADDNPYDPLLEPPPLPKGTTTLIGGIATSVDKVRNRLTVQPFGKGKKVKVFIDERSHIYRNGTETTVLGIHKGDRVYVDTMLASDNRIFARNVRVLTQTGLAEVRGQVLSSDPGRGTINVRDQLSAKPVSFYVDRATRYSSTKGEATLGDLQPGSLIDVEFTPRQDKAVAQEVKLLAKPGDNYIFSGKVTNVNMRTGSFFVDNTTDDQNYEVHFTRDSVNDFPALRVGAQVTARATFDGKQYVASNVHIEKPQPDQPEPQAPGQQPESQPTPDQQAPGQQSEVQ